MKEKVLLRVFFVLSVLLVFNSVVFSDYNSTVLTPNGSTVNVVVVTSELPAGDIAMILAWTQQNFPNVTILDYPTLKYNCHSYAWHWQSTSNNIWMDSPGDDTYWLDGSYYNVYYQISGDKVSYASDNHSGVFDGNNYVISKWGPGCLVRHLSNNCPYNSFLLRYYRR